MNNLINDDFGKEYRRAYLDQRSFEKGLEGQMGILGLIALNGVIWFYPLSTLGIV